MDESDRDASEAVMEAQRLVLRHPRDYVDHDSDVIALEPAGGDRLPERLTIGLGEHVDVPLFGLVPEQREERADDRSLAVLLCQESLVLDDVMPHQLLEALNLVFQVGTDVNTTLGATTAGPLVVAFYAERGDTIRVISARFPTRPERRAYEEEPG